MPIVAADIIFFYSGGAANTNANLSLGGVKSTTQWANNGALFDNIDSAENAASEAEYRCVYVQNNHATLTLQASKVYFTETAGGANIAIALAGEAISTAAETVANENTAPVGETFVTTPVSAATALVIGDLAPGAYKGIWLRRTAANTAAMNADGFVLNILGDTSA